MTDHTTLTLIRTVHTAIYLVMAASTFVLVYAGLTGATGVWLWVALGLLDTFLPERATRYTFRVFGTLMVAGLVLLAARWVGMLS